jgi:very-short-patch-repair endonuclease
MAFQGVPVDGRGVIHRLGIKGRANSFGHGSLSAVDIGRLNRVAARRRGLFTRADARACGFTAYQIRRRLATGEWRPVLGPVFVHNGLSISPELRDRAAVLAVPGSVLAGPSAARLLQMEVPVDRPCLIVGRQVRTRVPGLRLLYGEVEPADIAISDGIRLTWRPRTVFDCLRVLDEHTGTDLLDRALLLGWATVDSLARHIQGHIGCQGVDRVAGLIGRAASGARSAGERRLLAGLRAAGIGGWRANARVGGPDGPIGDVVFDRERVIVEVDGWAYHSNVGQFQRDRQRQNRLVADGWAVLRFTWRDLTERLDDVIRTIRAMLAQRQGPTAP